MYLIEGLLPFIRLLQFLCIAPFSISIKSRTIAYSHLFTIYSYLSFILFGLLFIHTFVQSNLYVVNPQNELGTTIDFIQLFGIRSAHIIIIVESYWKRNEQMAFLNKLVEFDEILVHKLSIDISYKKLLNHIWISLAVIITVSLGLQILFFGLCWNTDKSNLVYYWMAYLFPFIVISFRYYQTIISIWLIKARLNLLNNKLLTIREITTSLKNTNITNLLQENIGNNSSGNKIVTISRKHKFTSTVSHLDEKLKSNILHLSSTELLIIIRDAYDRLWELSNLINYTYGCSMLINIANDFVSIISNLYFLFVSLSYTFDIVSIFGSIIWSLPHLINVIVIAAMCHSCVQAANLTPLLVHKIDYDLVNDYSNNNNNNKYDNNVFIEQISLQLLHQKISFTAYGFFNVDFTLIFTMIGATTTYLVILIQFHMSSEI